MAVSAVLAREAAQHWVSRLAPLGIVVSGVATLDEALASEHTRARSMVVEIPTPAGPIQAVGNPIKISGTEGQFNAPPELGHDALRLLKKVG